MLETKAEYQRRWRAAHPGYKREWNKKNPDKYKKWFKENREQYNALTNKYRRNNLEKARARQAVHYAVKTGKLIRPDHCSKCLKLCKPEADHHDYTKKLDITWLCKSCHVEVTLERKTAIIKP